MSEQMIGELTSVLQKQRELYEQLLGIAGNKKDVLVKGDLAALDKCTRQEEQLVVQVGKLEDQRIKIQKALANHFHVPENQATVSFLLEKCSGDAVDSLSKESKALKTVLGTLRNVNNLNSEMIKQSLKYVEYTVNVLTSMGEVPSYPEKGGTSLEERVRTRLFDKTI